MRNKKLSIIKMVLLVLLLAVFPLIELCHAEFNASSPVWMEKGVFAEYTFKSGFTQLPTTGEGRAFDGVEFSNASFYWECIERNETMTKLRVMLNYTETKLNGKTLEEAQNKQLTTNVSVNLINRGVYLQNGTLIGTTMLWLPAKPTPNDDIVLWAAPFERITSKIDQGGIDIIGTPQGAQKMFKITKTGKINGTSAYFMVACEYDTGLMCQTFFKNEPVMWALGVKDFSMNGVMIFANTNIDLGPSENPLDPRSLFMAIAFPVSFVIVLIAVYSRRRKRKH